MAATSASAFSIGSTISHGSKASPLSQSKTCGMNISFNSQNNIKSFTGLKSSFLAKESTAALRYSFSQKSQNNPRTSSSALQIMASFNINAGIVRTLIEAVADNCPDAFIHIISNPVNSTVPIAAEVLKQKGVYNPKKLFGVTTLDVVRANTFVAEKKNLKLIDVDVPVVGGHAGITILPLLSKTKPSVTFSDQEVNDLTARIQNGGTEVVEAKAGAGSATLSMAYAAARFLESSLRALDGDSDVYECSFVQSEVTELPFFASRVKLGKQGVEAIISSDLEGLTEFEVKGLEALKAELKGSIEKGVAFAQKEKVTA
ncbi:putative malate dehydrogenase [Helianthus annuus]|nr:putative malate dehydrogenase [Helianthus annuus]